jgi:hypothetical protein
MRPFVARFAAALIASAVAGPTHGAPCHLADLGWMAGVWRSASADSRSEERWVVAPVDRLMGSSWSLHPAAPGGLVEIESIVADADGQVRLRVRHFGPALDKPWEALAVPMTFVAASCGRRRSPSTAKRTTPASTSVTAAQATCSPSLATSCTPASRSRW